MGFNGKLRINRNFICSLRDAFFLSWLLLLFSWVLFFAKI